MVPCPHWPTAACVVFPLGGAPCSHRPPPLFPVLLYLIDSSYAVELGRKNGEPWLRAALGRRKTGTREGKTRKTVEKGASVKHPWEIGLEDGIWVPPYSGSEYEPCWSGFSFASVPSLVYL
jgi:hypothetical protein